MKKNIFLSILSLVVTSFLLILTLFGWYTSNSHVEAGGIFASSAGKDYDLRLEFGKFEYTDDPTIEGDGWEWTWEKSDAMLFYDIQPGDAFFFRIVIESSKDVDLELSLGNVKSALMENMLFAYINNNLLEYKLSTDTTKQDNVDYYIGTFTKDTSVITGYPVKPLTYYERKFNAVPSNQTFVLGRTYYEQDNGSYKLSTDTSFVEGKTYYEAEYFLTSDTAFSNTKDYYKSRFILDEFPNLKKNQYYVVKAHEAITTPNAIGYRYQAEPPAYNYLYPIFNGTAGQKVVKITDTKNLYNIITTTEGGQSKTSVELADYKVEDVFKFHDIGVSYKNKSNVDTPYYDLFNKTNNLYECTYKATTDTTMNPNKKYYVRNNTVYEGDYVEYVADSFELGRTYYEKVGLTLDGSGNPKPLYANDYIKEASASFNTSYRQEVTEDGREVELTYYYFALEFNEQDSLEDIYGVESSNCYLYQSLRISELRVQKVNDEEE